MKFDINYSDSIIILDSLTEFHFSFVTATRAEVETDVALYIGLAVACTVFAVLSALIFRLFRRKGRDHSMYNMAVSGESMA